MRIGYSEDEDFPGQFDLWQANCQRSINGKYGQIALRALEAALVALPEKRLIAGELIDDEGEVCAIGALAKQKGKAEELRAEAEDNMEGVGVMLGMPRMVAWKVVEVNDIELDSRWDYRGSGGIIRYTPEERYQHMLAWVRRQLAKEQANEQNGGRGV